MRITKTKIMTVLAALLLAAPAYAQSDDDEDSGPRALNFGDLEYAVPRDPLLWSSSPPFAEQHTPKSWIAPAVERLRTAIPLGTSAEEAAAIIHKAGAKCKSVAASELTCTYRDAQTPYPDDIDSVVWTVSFALADGRVSDMNVKRNWYRHS